MNDLTYTHIIVGAGTAGCLLANRLSAAPANRVLLIEAGGNDDYMWVHIPVGYLYCIGNPRTDWLYFTEPDAGLNGRKLRYPRGKVLGGCSSINGMIYMRGQSRDYDGWAAATGDARWRWDDCLPYFKRHEDHWRGASEAHAAPGFDPKGQRAVYCSLDPATCIVEAAVHRGFAVLGTTAAYFEHFLYGDRQPLVITQGRWLSPKEVHESIGIRPFVDATPVVRSAAALPVPRLAAEERRSRIISSSSSRPVAPKVARPWLSRISATRAARASGVLPCAISRAAALPGCQVRQRSERRANSVWLIGMPPAIWFRYSPNPICSIRASIWPNCPACASRPAQAFSWRSAST